MKKKLSENQEFEIMKLVLDKFLWVGTIVMVFGLYQMVEGLFLKGVSFIALGSFLLLLFLIFIVKEYEIVK
jgi:hypothetical protein